MSDVTQPRGQLVLNVLLGAHRGKFFSVIRVVVVNCVAQPFVCIREGRIGSELIENCLREYLARLLHTRIELRRHLEPACGCGRLLRLGRVPAPAKIPIVARPKALPALALLALLVAHGYQRVLVRDAYLSVAPPPAARAGYVHVELVARVSRTGRVPAPAFFDQIARVPALILVSRRMCRAMRSHPDDLPGPLSKRRIVHLR